MTGTARRRSATGRTQAQPGPDGAGAPTVAGSAALGAAARKAVPPASHAAFEPAPGRSDPVEVLERQSRTRVPELVPIRYGRMLVSPFTFYRGAAAIMAEDLASTPRSGFRVQCCGDAHLSNFGVFGSPSRRLVLDINDFDETHPGPWEWDVKRLSASMLIAAQSNSFSKKDQRRAVLEAVRSYRTSMASFATMGALGVWYSRFDVEDVLRKYAAELKPRTVKSTKKGARQGPDAGQPLGDGQAHPQERSMFDIASLISGAGAVAAAAVPVVAVLVLLAWLRAGDLSDLFIVPSARGRRDDHVAEEADPPRWRLDRDDEDIAAWAVGRGERRARAVARWWRWGRVELPVQNPSPGTSYERVRWFSSAGRTPIGRLPSGPST